MKDHKLYELTINEDGIRFRHANPNPMSAGQKYNIVVALVGCVTAVILASLFFSLFH